MPELNVSVIMPFKDKAKMTLKAVHSLIEYCAPVKEILLVSNNSTDNELQQIKQALATIHHAKLLIYNHPFNYQKINNWAVKQSSGEYILFLNNDTELNVHSRGLIESMYKKASEVNIGMVGCLLLYGDEKTIQHAGVFLRPGLQGDHLYVGHRLKDALKFAGTQKYPYDIRQGRPLTAVTGAVQIVSRQKFDDVNGFDERFIICGGDVDLCIRLNKKGFQTWYIGTTKYIVHKESQSRSYKPIPYIDFYHSYESYISAYDLKHGDPFLPKVTEVMN